MGRPPGALNRTPRELAAAAAHLKKEAKLKKRLAEKAKQIEALKKKKATRK
jgi:hypothetical protein